MPAVLRISEKRIKEVADVSKIKTMGRFPTVGEMFEYYSRDDISAVMYYQTKRWRILMNFGSNYMLEPTSERDTRDKILDQLLAWPEI